jgi:hypothetical protein
MNILRQVPLLEEAAAPGSASVVDARTLWVGQVRARGPGRALQRLGRRVARTRTEFRGCRRCRGTWRQSRPRRSRHSSRRSAPC